MSQPSGALGLGERLQVEAAIETAFEPIRGRRSAVGPTRVRAAVRWGRAEPPVPVAWAAAVRRISELGVAVGVSAFVFAAAITSTPPPGAPVPVSEVEVVDDVLEAPVQEVRLSWTPRIVPEDPERALRTLLRQLKSGRPVAVEDRIDATIPPLMPEQPAEVVVLPQPLLARLFIPVR